MVSSANNNNPQTSSGLTYADSGVDIDAGNALVQAIKPMIAKTNRPGVTGGIGGFGGLFDLKKTGYEDPLLVAANDGVGTKLKIAIETGINHTIGIDLVAMCVNDLIVQGAEPLFFLDYFACGKLDQKVASDVISGIAEGCAEAGAALIGGETAEMPGMYQADDYDLAGFAVGAVERSALLPRKNIKAGDKILGLTSNGVHSNGFSLVRKVIEQHKLSLEDQAPFADGISLAEVLLAPTRIYVKSLLNAVQASSNIKALAHITGGGFVENIPRILPHDLSANLNLATIPDQPVFSWLSQAGKIPMHEMLRTFNCGIGMCIVVEAGTEGKVKELLTENQETVIEFGEITQSDIKQNAEQVVFENNPPFSK